MIRALLVASAAALAAGVAARAAPVAALRPAHHLETSMTPYYADDLVTLYHGDMRNVLPALNITADCIVTDPPYGETSLTWDRWPDGWVRTAAEHTDSMWCFGSMRMFLDRRDDFDYWRMSQDVIWEKHNGTGFAADRFKRVHEHAVHWYRGPWHQIHHDVPRTEWDGPNNGRTAKRRSQPAHTGAVAASGWADDGTRLARSVQKIQSMHHRAIHPTEKPVELLDLLIRYACPEGGQVLDPFAGSGSTAAAARLSGRRAVLVEGDERYCELIARRLAQDVLPIGATA